MRLGRFFYCVTADPGGCSPGCCAAGRRMLVIPGSRGAHSRRPGCRLRGGQQTDGQPLGAGGPGLLAHTSWRDLVPGTRRVMQSVRQRRNYVLDIKSPTASEAQVSLAPLLISARFLFKLFFST